STAVDHATAANAVLVAPCRNVSSAGLSSPAAGGRPNDSVAPPSPAARTKTAVATAPMMATARSPATRATALLTPDAVPVSLSSTEVITAVDSGVTTNPIPIPII